MTSWLETLPHGKTERTQDVASLARSLLARIGADNPSAAGALANPQEICRS